MRIIRVLRQEPNRITAVAVSVLGVLTLFDLVSWTDVQIGGVLLAFGALLELVRSIVAPTMAKPKL